MYSLENRPGCSLCWIQMVPVHFCQLPKAPITQDMAEPVSKGGHAFVVIYLRKKKEHWREVKRREL